MDLNNLTLSKEDYKSVAILHSNYINKGFLSSLGVPFLTLLYEAIDKDKKSVLIVKKVDAVVVGYVTGSSGMSSIYFQLVLRLPRLLWALLPCIFSPSKIHKIFEILLIGSENKLSKNLPHEELLSIVVHPNFQGEGHADQLFSELCIYYTKKKCEGFRIIVGESLLRAHSFYKRLGSKAVGEIEVHKGENSIVYLKKLINMETPSIGR